MGRGMTTGLTLLTAMLLLAPTAREHVGPPVCLLLASAAEPSLRLAGFDVTRDGTAPTWREQTFVVAPECAGLRKLAAGLLLACALAWRHELSWRRTVAALGLTIVAMLAGSLLRIVSLFYSEIVLRTEMAWIHDGSGAVAFGLCAVAVAYVVRCLTPSATA